MPRSSMSIWICPCCQVQQKALLGDDEDETYPVADLVRYYSCTKITSV